MEMFGFSIVLFLIPFVSGYLLNEGDPAIYRDCDDLMNYGGYTTSGPYRVFMPEVAKPLEVLCRYDVNASISAYTAIMVQKYGRISFDRSYAQYVTGFGSAAMGDFWIGLEYMKYLSDKGKHVLTITLQDWSNEIKNIQYRLFKLGNPRDRFRLLIGGYSSSSVLPDDLSFNSGHRFATSDVPDVHDCARKMSTGWWFNYCTYALPTGKYYNGGEYKPLGKMYDGIFYKDWQGYGYSLKFIRMELSGYND